MGWIVYEPVRFLIPAFHDMFEGREAAQSLQAARVIVGVSEGLQIRSQLVVVCLGVAFDGGVFDRAVHAFDLAVRPWMVRLGQAVLDAVLGPDTVEQIAYGLGGRSIASRVTKLHAGIG